MPLIVIGISTISRMIGTSAKYTPSGTRKPERQPQTVGLQHAQNLNGDRAQQHVSHRQMKARVPLDGGDEPLASVASAWQPRQDARGANGGARAEHDGKRRRTQHRQQRERRKQRTDVDEAARQECACDGDHQNRHDPK